MQPASMAHLRLARLEAITVGTLEWLTGEERQRLDAMASPERRRNYVAGHSLARELGARWHGVDIARLSVHRLADGRPCLHLDGAPSPLSLSLSHSGGWILAGIATVPIGVDVEVPRRARDIDALARHVFAPEEAGRLAAMASDGRLGAFHEIWALKEARGKRTGEGILPGRSRRVRAVAAAPGAADAISWRLGEAGAAAVAVQGVEAVRVDDDGLLGQPRHWCFESVELP